MTDAEVVAEALSYGLDVEPERADTQAVRESVEALREMDEETRAAAVEHLNEGWPIQTFGWPEECFDNPLGLQVKAELARVRRATKARAKAEVEWREAIRAAVDAGATVRVVAEAAGVSHVRVVQLAHA